MKSIQIKHKGGIGNILQAIPLIKFCLEEFPEIKLFLNFTPDYEATMELFENWSRHTEGRIEVAKTKGETVLDLWPVRITSPITGTTYLRTKSLVLGESQVYLKIATDEPRFDIDCTAPLHSEIDLKLPKEYIVIWPGCKKNWPIKAYPHYEGLIGQFLEKISVVLVGQKRELFIKRIPGKAINLLDQLSLGEVAGVIRGAKAFIGNDGGITHLAATTGIPTYALFGPTSIIKNKPRAENARVISASLGCMPCQETPGFSYNKCKMKLKPNCLERLSPWLILNRVWSECFLD